MKIIVEFTMTNIIKANVTIATVLLEDGLEHLDHFRFGFVPHGSADEDHGNLISPT